MGVSWMTTPFANALVLGGSDPATTEDATSLEVMTWWTVVAPLPVPQEELVPYPPPPGVYSGPRMAIFAHLYQDDTLLAIDDGLWVDPYTLVPGDTFVQVTFPGRAE